MCEILKNNKLYITFFIINNSKKVGNNKSICEHMYYD